MTFCPMCQACAPGHPAPVHLHSALYEGFQVTLFWSNGSISHRSWHGKPIEGNCW